jgi:PII-like signaling protein
MKRYLGAKKVVRIYIDSADTFDGKPLWQYLIHRAKADGLAGATVFKGVAGMGAHSEIHTFEIWALAQKLPVVIEIIDDAEKIDAFLDRYDTAIEEGLITLSDVEVIRYKHPQFAREE